VVLVVVKLSKTVMDT